MKEYDSMEEEWTHNNEKVNLFFSANDVLTEGKKRDFFVGNRHASCSPGGSSSKQTAGEHVWAIMHFNGKTH